MEDIISQLHILDYINVYLIMFLMAWGFIIKHTRNNVANKYIPYILIIVSLIYEGIALKEYNSIAIMNAVVDGIISAAIAIGLHSSGKQIIKSICQNKSIISTLTNSLNENETNEEEYEEKTDNEDLNE